MFLPILVLADWAADRHQAPAFRASGPEWRDALVVYGPFVVVLALYLLPDLWINQQSYIVTEGYYRFGLHVDPATRSTTSCRCTSARRCLASYIVIVALPRVVRAPRQPARPLRDRAGCCSR